jgi:hypothetical protein
VENFIGGVPPANDVLYLFGAESYAESTGNAPPEGIKMIVRLHEMQQKDA